jgi:methionine-rich copper-binding protein CopC
MGRFVSSSRTALVCGLVAAIVLVSPASGASAHAFLLRSEPRVEATLSKSPEEIRIWFDSPVEPLYVEIRVENGEKRRVDKRDGRLNPRDNTLVQAGLPPLSPGRYRVFWSVIARDGHRKEGTFSFRVK